MKKFLTIVAGVIVLGAGVYVEPASGSTPISQLNQRHNSLHRQIQGSVFSPHNCWIWAEQVSVLNSALNSGDYLVGTEDGSDDFGKYHDLQTKNMMTNVKDCQARGIPTGSIIPTRTTAAQISAAERSRNAPVAQVPSVSDIRNVFRSAEASMGLPSGALGARSGIQQRQNQCRQTGGEWQWGAGGYCAHNRSTGASHGGDLRGLL